MISGVRSDWALPLRLEPARLGHSRLDALPRVLARLARVLSRFTSFPLRTFESDLASAIDNEELELAFQAIVKLDSCQICGFEALLRWRHPVRGLVPPAEFIPLAEQTGLIDQIGEWVLKEACAEASTWPKGISVAVNVSAIQLADCDLVEKVRTILHDSNIDPSRVELEITESVPLQESKGHLERLNGLHNLGVRIAIDDFGMGYCSLASLRLFQFNGLKIDRSYVRGVPASPDATAIVRAIAGLGKALGLSTTAEGVETTRQLQAVRRAGCDQAQGFLLCKPVPATQVRELLSGGLSQASSRPCLMRHGHRSPEKDITHGDS